MENVKDLFNMAMEWYLSGNHGKREAALDLFPETLLKNEAEKWKSKNRDERKKARDKELKKLLGKAEKLFPKGTLVWNDDGSDECINVIVSKPYIGKNSNRCPYGKYTTEDCRFEDRETVLAEAARVEYFGNEPFEGPFGRTLVGIERLMENNVHPILTPKEYREIKEVQKQKRLKGLHKMAEKYKDELDAVNKEIEKVEAYDPEDFTEEKIMEIVRQFSR